jgi:translation initiation factor 1 (eIF-1/SUI1)
MHDLWHWKEIYKRNVKTIKIMKSDIRKTGTYVTCIENFHNDTYTFLYHQLKLFNVQHSD